MFDEQVNALVPEYRVLIWDVRGHGDSRPVHGSFTLADCADDLFAILDSLGASRAVLVGQSMGGYISQHAYLRHPERVRAMVIVGAPCIAFPYSHLEILALKATMPLFRLWSYGHFKRVVAHNTAITPGARAYAQAALEKLSHKEFLAIWKAVTLALDDQGIPDHHIQIPMLLTHGEHDHTGTIRRDAPKWAAYEPDVEYVVSPDAGHNANQDNPTFFNRTLLDFLRRRVPS